MSITHHRRRTLPCHIERDVLHSARAYSRHIGRPTTDVVAEAVAQYLDRQAEAQTQPYADAVAG